MGGMDGGMFTSLLYMLLGYVIEEWFLSSFVSHHSQTGGMIKFKIRKFLIESLINNLRFSLSGDY